MAELTLERLAKLEMLRAAVERALDACAGNRDEALALNHDGANLVYMANLANSAPELFAATRRLLELESALEFISCFHGFQVLNESCPGEPMYAASIDDHMGQTRATPGEAVVALATEAGWPGIESGKHLEQSE